MVAPMINIARSCLFTWSLCTSFAVLAGEAGPSLVKGPDAKLMGETIASEFALDKDSRIVGIQLSLPIAVVEKAAHLPMTSLKIDLPVMLQKDSLVQYINIDWNPDGHDPAHVYDRPHFDFHFYFISQDRVAEIDCSDQTPVPVSLVPADYVLPPLNAPTACIPGMGIHAVPVKDLSPGFEFTETPIYGYYEGKLIFFEPMITRDHLVARRPVTQKIQYPGEYLVNVKKHFVPKNFRMTFDAKSQAYQVILDN